MLNTFERRAITKPGKLAPSLRVATKIASYLVFVAWSRTALRTPPWSAAIFAHNAARPNRLNRPFAPGCARIRVRCFMALKVFDFVASKQAA